MRVSRSEVRIAAPREVVWAVLTEPRYVRQWQYGSDLHTDWSVGAPIRFTTTWEGNTFEQRGDVLFVNAPHELRYSLFAPQPGLPDLPQNRFIMTYALADDAGLTLLTISREDPRPAEADTESREDSENPVLTALKDLCESLVSQPASTPDLEDEMKDDERP
jgi:uncharacterized protein YndB with AHSA1/START domain